MMFETMKGVVATDVAVGQVITQQIDGKFYLASAGDRLRGVAVEPLHKGQKIETDDRGHWRAARDQSSRS